MIIYFQKLNNNFLNFKNLAKNIEANLVYNNLNNMKLKKSKYIYVIENGIRKKQENINDVSPSFIVDQIKKENSIFLKEIDSKKGIYFFKKYILIFKKFQRDHTSGNGEINENENFRSRYTKNELLNFRTLFEKYGKYVIVLSYYYTKDKIILVANEITSILFTKKSKIRSDSRINSMKISDFEKAYKNIFWKKLYDKKNNIVPYVYSFHSNVFSYFFDKLSSFEISFPNYYSFNNMVNFYEKNVSNIWREASFNKMKILLNELKKNEFVGELGEYISFNILEKKDKNVIWSSKINSRSNHDIKILNKYYYEIKSTGILDSNTFILSKSEKLFMEEKTNSWFLWRMSLKNILEDIDFNSFEKEKNFRKIILKKIEENKINYKELQAKDIDRLNSEPIGYRVKI